MFIHSSNNAHTETQVLQNHKLVVCPAFLYQTEKKIWDKHFENYDFGEVGFPYNIGLVQPDIPLPRVLAVVWLNNSRALVLDRGEGGGG